MLWRGLEIYFRGFVLLAAVLVFASMPALGEVLADTAEPDMAYGVSAGLQGGVERMRVPVPEEAAASKGRAADSKALKNRAEAPESRKSENPKEKSKDKKSFWDRYFELGFSVAPGVSNSYFSLGSIFQEELVIDFNKMVSSKLLGRGLTVNSGLGTDFFLNLNMNKFKLGFFTDVDADVLACVDRDLFEFLANGNELDTPVNMGMGLGASVFASTGFDVRFKVGKWHFQASPSLYVPIVYVPYKSIVLTTVLGSDGSVSMSTSGSGNLYSALPVDAIVNSNGNFQFNGGDLMSQSGFDLGVTAMYRLLPALKVGGYVQGIPIVPSRVRHGFTYSLTAEFTGAPVLPSVVNNGTYNVNDPQFNASFTSVGQTRQTVLRPLRFGVLADWKPLSSDYLVLSGGLELRFLDTIVKNNAGSGFGYHVRLHSEIGPFIPYFETSFMDEIFTHTLGFNLNLRFVELQLGASLESHNFIKSFAATGAAVDLGLIFGF